MKLTSNGGTGWIMSETEEAIFHRPNDNFKNFYTIFTMLIWGAKPLQLGGTITSC